MKLIKLLTLTISIILCYSNVHASPAPDYRDYKYCTLAVQFEKLNESNFKVKNVTLTNHDGLNADALRKSYIAVFSYGEGEYTVGVRSNSAGKFIDSNGRTYTNTILNWNNLKCTDQIKLRCYHQQGSEDSCEKVMKTNSWEMVSSGFNNDFLTSDLTKPYIESCDNYIRWNKETTAKNRAEDLARHETEKQAKISFTNDLTTGTNLFRSKLKPAEVTNCGTVIELKGKGNQQMIHVQTGSDARDIWIGITNIYPQKISNQMIGCKDANRWYKRYGNWTQDGGRSTFSNYGTQYYDFE